MNNFFIEIMRTVDPFLIAPYRLTGDAFAGFLIGTFCLCMLCVVLGELTISAAIRLNRKHLQELKQEITHKERLSMQAYAEDDKVSYKALNKEASEAWGRHFFTMAAYSAGILWPVPFALAWMQSRFQSVDFELIFPLNRLIGENVGYPFIFIPMYILARIVFKYLRPRLPYFRGVQAMLDKSGAESG
ncbi:MAG: hypothetical protein KKH85_03475 [Proteobacteria bacterium]|nr:hypothetical protein [Pseudomonadota bacterium]